MRPRERRGGRPARRAEDEVGQQRAGAGRRTISSWIGGRRTRSGGRARSRRGSAVASRGGRWVAPPIARRRSSTRGAASGWRGHHQAHLLAHERLAREVGVDGRGWPSYSSPTTASRCPSRSADALLDLDLGRLDATSGWLRERATRGDDAQERGLERGDPDAPAGRPATSAASPPRRPPPGRAARPRADEAAGVGEAHVRPVRSSSFAPASRSSTASCWETALGV